MERLDLRLAEYFVAVAEELHFGRAAERLHIAQPSLSQQIRRLESQLGVVLLERNSRSVHLTDAGEALLVEGRKTLSQASHAIQTTRAAGVPGLTVGFYGSAANDLLPSALTAFGERHRTVSVSVPELPLGSIDAILDGDVNVAFTRLQPGQTELEIEVIASEPRVVALATAHPLATRGSLAFADLPCELHHQPGRARPRPATAKMACRTAPSRASRTRGRQQHWRDGGPDVGGRQPRHMPGALSRRPPLSPQGHRLRAHRRRRARSRVSRLATRVRDHGARGVHRNRARSRRPPRHGTIRQ
jgi:DNA-binding transcriptional LysR family regulator